MRKQEAQEVMEQVRGKNLDTPTQEIRVFNICDPNYTYRFERQDGSEVLVVDDNNGRAGSGQGLKMFPADELVNVAVFTEALLKANESPLPHPPSHK